MLHFGVVFLMMELRKTGPRAVNACIGLSKSGCNSGTGSFSRFDRPISATCSLIKSFDLNRRAIEKRRGDRGHLTKNGSLSRVHAMMFSWVFIDVREGKRTIGEISHLRLICRYCVELSHNVLFHKRVSTSRLKTKEFVSKCPIQQTGSISCSHGALASPNRASFTACHHRKNPDRAIISNNHNRCKF
jgi:hypothetical protein